MKKIRYSIIPLFHFRMKKIVWFIIILAMLGGATNGCVSALVNDDENEKETETEPDPDPDPDPEKPTDEKKEYSLQFALNNVDGDAPFVLDWSNYRSVGLLLNDDQGNTVYVNKELSIPKVSGNEIVLLVDSVKTDQTNGQGYAYAPYNASISGTVLTGNLNATQNQLVSSSKTMDNSLKNNMMLVADPATFKFDQGTCQFYLKSIFSIIQLTVEDEASVLPSDRSIQAVTLYIAGINNIQTQINSSPLAGSYSIDLTNNTSGPQFYNPSYSITANVTASTATMITSRPVLYFIVNPFTLKSNETLVARVVTDGGDVIYASFNISPVRNRIYALRAVATTENTYIETPAPDNRYSSTYSNCYVISEKGRYIFPADKTMNGQMLAGANKAEWLWASKEGGGTFNINELIDPLSVFYNLSTATITFQVGDKNPYSTLQKGNVILALKTADDEIVWTYHIWITDEPEELRHETRWFLDRNIGALSVQNGSSPVDNFGFVYQWGRKDPFFGGDGRTNETAAMSIARANTIVNNGSWPVPAQATATAATAAKNPMTFYCNPTTSTNLNTPVDWSSENNTASRWPENAKTDNDPCPDGYRVPNRAELKVLHNGYEVGNDEVWSFRNEPSWHWRWEYTYSYNNEIITSIWPTAGMRQGRYRLNGNSGGRLLDSGTAETRGKCYYWSSSPVVLNDNSVLPGGAYRIYTSGSILYENEFGDKADAYPVRCVALH